MVERFWAEEDTRISGAHDELDGVLIEAGRPIGTEAEEKARSEQESMWAELEALDRGDMAAVMRIRKAREEAGS